MFNETKIFATITIQVNYFQNMILMLFYKSMEWNISSKSVFYLIYLKLLVIEYLIKKCLKNAINKLYFYEDLYIIYIII